MPTECSADLFGFASVEGREVVAAFDGGAITSDAGALLLGAADRAIKLTERLAACFHDVRRQDLIEHEVVTLVGQRVFGIALGYEDLNDHDDLRHDPVMAVLAGKLEARRDDCAPVAGKSTLNRLELSRLEATRYHRISHNPIAIKRLMRTSVRRARSSSISMRPTIRCTVSRRGGSSTPIMTVTAIFRCTCSAGDICWLRSCGRRVSTQQRGRLGKWRASLPRYVGAGRMCAFCYAPTVGLRARS